MVWVISGLVMYENHKNDYRNGYLDGYQSRINYENWR